MFNLHCQANPGFFVDHWHRDPTPSIVTIWLLYKWRVLDHLYSLYGEELHRALSFWFADLGDTHISFKHTNKLTVVFVAVMSLISINT
jgi:hypothetical protein